MMKCIKCGASNSEILDVCTVCTWPVALKGWGVTKLKVKRITFDTCCVNAKKRDISLNTLEEWAKQGLVEVQKAHTFMEELKGEERIKKAEKMDDHPGLFTFGMSTFGGGDVLAGPDMADEIKEMLFPTTKVLTKNQIYDVQHLREHIQTGGDIFVTFDNHFIKNGKQATLRQYGIWVFKPVEAVAFLKKQYDWK